MNNNGYPAASSEVLFVKPWIRGFMCLVCAVPIAAVVGAFARQAVTPGSNLLIAAVVCGVVAVAFAWLFVRLYSLCSISVSKEGVAQSFLLRGGALKSSSNVPWDRVQQVSFSRLSYHFQRLKKLLKRRQVVEPMIGHMKADGLLGRNWLKGAEGDALHALLCGAGHNLRMILRHLRVLYCVVLSAVGMVASLLWQVLIPSLPLGICAGRQSSATCG